LTIVQEKNYYPFGLKHKGYNNIVRGTENKHFTYNGKEHAEALGLNFIEMDWRQYDPATGRFITIDALADLPEQVDLTPYNFAWNNPIMYSDPSGLCPECPDSSDFNVGDTHNINGSTYVIDQDGQWAREGGQLEEVVINSGSSSEETNNDGIDGAKLVVLGRALPVSELSGFAKFSAEAQLNNPWLFGRRTSDDGLSYVDAAGNRTGIVPMGAPVNLPFGPGGAKKEC